MSTSDHSATLIPFPESRIVRRAPGSDRHGRPSEDREQEPQRGGAAQSALSWLAEHESPVIGP